jgi:type I restriction enzyme M protein
MFCQSEADTRMLIDESLKNKGYILSGKNKNVFCEKPRSEEENKKLKGKRPDYVIYSKNTDTPLMIIEAKKPGERIDTALTQGVSYALALGAPIVFATDGVFCKSLHTKFNKNLILNGEEIDEFIREALALKFLNDYEVNTISKEVQVGRKDLIRVFGEANNMLRAEGLRAGIDRFGEFANILFLKLISEAEDIKQESGERSNFDRMYHWDYIKNQDPNARINYINQLVFPKLNELYQTEIFTPLQMRDSSTLREIIDKLDPLKLNDVNSDIKGDAFEYFLRESTASGNDLGEYFTPRHIVKTMVRLVNPQIGEKIYDPFCGTGGMLIESFRHIWNQMARTNDNITRLRQSTIYGNEITNTARITKMNMILAGDGHSNINMVDSLANPVDGEYDIVITNMPYSQKTKHSGKYDIPSNNGDSICVQHCVKAINGLSENGRMALVVPEGFLFRKDLAKTREYLMEKCNLRSVISLPQGIFLPYTGVKTDIIYCDKVNNKNRKTVTSKHYWYFVVKNDGYTLDNHRRKIEGENDLEKYAEFRKLDDGQNKQMQEIGFDAIPFDKVRKNDFVLIGSRYKEAEQINSKYEIVKLGDIAEIIAGQSPEGQYYNQDGNGLPFYQGRTEFGTTFIKEPKTWTTQITKIAHKDDILMSVRAPVGPVNVCGFNEICIGRGLAAIRVNNKAVCQYVYWLLKSMEDKITGNGGAVFDSINKKQIEEIRIPLPPLEKQREIAAEIETKQIAIDNAKKIIKSLTRERNNAGILLDGLEYEKVALNDLLDYEQPTAYIVEHTNYKNEYKIPVLTAGQTFVLGKTDETKGIFYRLPAIIFDDFTTASKYVDFPFKVKSSAMKILTNKNSNRSNLKFIYLMMQGIKFNNETHKRYWISEYSNIKIPLPSLANQERIVAAQEEEQTIIDANRRLIDIMADKITKTIEQIYKE